MPAPRPVPIELNKLRGNPSRRPINDAAPTPKIQRPPCPKHITGEARKEWNRVCKDLIALRLLGKIDRAALAAYCQTWAAWVESCEKLQIDGMYSTTPNGYVQQSAAFTTMMQTAKAMKAYLVEFGMTPAARAKLTVEKPPDDNIDDFLDKVLSER